MKAVMYGGGNIGRGFIGARLSASGYHVTFIDVVESVVEQLHTDGCYPVRIVSSEGHFDTDVVNVDAVNGNDAEAASEIIAEADVMATAVGAKILKFIAPNVAAGLKKRFARTDRPLDIIICENLMDANKVFEGLVKQYLSPEEQKLMDERVGLVEASIGRMVPVQTDEMKDGNPLRVCVEAYGYLPVDRDAFRGEIPAIEGLVPYSPFDFYIKRKLYIHNMGHATCAYLGLYTDKTFIWQSIDDADTLAITQNAMLQSAEALCAKYGFAFADVKRHIDDLLYRFTNRALGDTCKRVGGDPTRKLAAADRMIGASHCCTEQGIMPVFICVGAAGAVYEYLAEAEQPQDEAHARGVLRDVSQMADDDALLPVILEFFNMFTAGASLAELRRAAVTKQASYRRDIV